MSLASLGLIPQQASIVGPVPVSAQASFDGADGRLAFPDESENDSFFVFRGDAAISIAQANLGTGSVRFDGASDFIDIYAPESTPEDLHFAIPGSPATVEFFFRSDDATQTDTLYSSNDDTFEDDLKIATVGSQIWARLHATGSNVLTIQGGSLSSATWHHVAVVWDGTVMTVYLDGTSVGSGTPSSPVTTNNNPKTLGYDRQSTTQSFAGYIEGFRFSKGEVYTGSFTPPVTHFAPERAKDAPPAPNSANVVHLAAWEGAEGDTTYVDESAAAPTLTFTNGANISTNRSKFGSSSLFLDGTNEFVTIANSTAVSLASQSQHTIEAWVSPDATCLTKTSSIFNKRDGASAEEYRLTHRGTAAGGGDLDFITFQSGNARAQCLTRGGLLVADTWSHVVAVRDGNRYMLFVDGELEGSDYTTTAPSANSQGPRIGSSAFDSDRDWSGYIDQTRITNEVFYPTIGFNVIENGLAEVNAPRPATAMAFWNLYPGEYTGDCLLIERLSDNATQAIGFDATGVLDTAAIAAFCGSSDGRIVEWYDQANGGAVGMTSPFVSNRLRIYNGASGQMNVDSDGHIAWPMGAAFPKFSYNAVNDPATFMTKMQTADTFGLAFGYGTNSTYVGLWQSGSTSTFVNNDEGVGSAGTHYKDGVLQTVANRGDMFTAFCDNNSHRICSIGNQNFSTGGNRVTIGIYDDSVGNSVSTNSGFHGGYAMIWATELSATEVAAVDTYLAANVP